MTRKSSGSADALSAKATDFADIVQYACADVSGRDRLRSRDRTLLCLRIADPFQAAGL
jgi:hypothetical protein